MTASDRSARIAWIVATLWLASCSGSRDDSVNVGNIGRKDASTDAAAEAEEDAGDQPTETDEDASAPDMDGEVEPPIPDAGDPDVIISVEVADSGPAVDATVVVETARCGDGVTDPDEECDRGASNSNTVPNACRANCHVARCGDGVTDQGEACDQGANNSDSQPDACRTNCTAARCGDNVVDQGEQCDSGDARSNTAPGACRLDCRNARCGDSVRDPDEGCDDGNTVDTDACRNSCRTPGCGNNVPDPGEECDDGNNTNGDGCQANCRRPICGDRVPDPGEQCDDGNTVDNDGCRNTCQTGCSSRAPQLCSDGLFCNGVETCGANGVCAPAAAGPTLSDGIACTVDACDEAGDRVTHTANDTLCTVAGPSCSLPGGTTTLRGTCDVARGCVTTSTTTPCSDTASSCTLRGDGSQTLTTYAPACNPDMMSCAAATPSTTTCNHIQSSCTVGRSFTPRADATCDPNIERCGNQAVTAQNCAAVDSASCAADNSSYTQVRGTCTPTGAGAGCASTRDVTPCPDPADSCTNAHRTTYAPTCTAADGCGRERTVIDEDCRALPQTCGTDGVTRAPAVRRWVAACDPRNNGQCLVDGVPQEPEPCSGRGLVCTESAPGSASVTNYVAGCNGTSCAIGGVPFGTAMPCTDLPDTCGPNPDPAAPRGSMRQIVYTPACETGSSCFRDGRAVTTTCSAGAATCEVDGQGRAFQTTRRAACNDLSTACLPNGAPAIAYCDQLATECRNGAAVDYGNVCDGAGCGSTSRTCPTTQYPACNAATNSLEERRGTCRSGEGCTYDVLRSSPCAAPICINTGATALACGGCGVNADGVSVCDAPCVPCPNGCSGGRCRPPVIIRDPPIGTLGGVISQGAGAVAPGGVIP